MNATERAERDRTIAMITAVQAAVPWGLNHGDIDRVVEIARDTRRGYDRRTNIAGALVHGDPRAVAEDWLDVADGVLAAVQEQDRAHSRDQETAVAQRRELAAAIAAQAGALADGTLVGSEHAAVALLTSNIETLHAWTPDDRT